MLVLGGRVFGQLSRAFLGERRGMVALVGVIEDRDFVGPGLSDVKRATPFGRGGGVERLVRWRQNISPKELPI